MPWYEAGVTTGDPPGSCPGDVLELRVYDDTGKEQGTILGGTWRVASKYKGGEVIEGHFLGASDIYYQWWMNEGEGAPNRHKGWYHLCRGPTKECPPTTKHKNMVHSDRYRNLGPKVLGSKRIPWLGDKVLLDACLDKFKKFRDELNQGPPMKAPAKQKTPEPVARWAGADDAGSESSEDGDSSSDEESAQDRGMKDKIAELKAQLKKAEGEAVEHKRRKKASRAKSDPAGKSVKKDKKRKKRDPAAAGAGAGDKEAQVKKAKKKKKKRDDSSDGEAKKKKKKKKRGSPGSQESEEPSKRRKKKADLEDSSESSSGRGGGLFQQKQEADQGESARERDRGPFGGGSPIEFSDGDSTEEEESVFRKGSTAPAKSSQQRLLRYARKYPGRLASRLLMKMQEGTARGAVGPSREKLAKTPVVALNYILTILLPSLAQRAGVRSTRELKTLGTIMDHLAAGSPSRAADVVGQRIKALERATQEGHWGAAQFLELLAPEGTMLLDRDEESYLAKEFLLDQKLKTYDKGPNRKEREQKGKGKDGGGAKGKGKDRGAKGTGNWDKTAPKKDEAK